MINLKDALIEQGNNPYVIDDIIKEMNYNISDGMSKKEVLEKYGLNPYDIIEYNIKNSNYF